MKPLKVMPGGWHHHLYFVTCSFIDEHFRNPHFYRDISGQDKTSKDLITIICDIKELNGNIFSGGFVFDPF